MNDIEVRTDSLESQEGVELSNLKTIVHQANPQLADEASLSKNGSQLSI